MKPAWFAAFALPLLCTSLLYPQDNPANTPATSNTSPDAKAAAAPEAQEPAPAATTPAPPRKDAEIVAKATGKDADLGEAELKARLTGRPLFLRGLWLGENLHFNMNGDLVGQSTKGSFTLCGCLSIRCG